jgi:hypothetical protein
VCCTPVPQIFTFRRTRIQTTMTTNEVHGQQTPVNSVMLVIGLEVRDFATMRIMRVPWPPEIGSRGVSG